MSSFFINTENLSNFDKVCAEADHNMPYPTEDQVQQLGYSIANELLDVILNTGLEDHASIVMEGIIGGLHSAARRIEREADRAYSEMKRLAREYAGSEITDNEMIEATQKARRADASVMIVETIRDAAAENYTTQTGEVWRPWTGSAKNAATSAALVDVREAIRTRDTAHTKLTMPSSQVVVFRGAKEADSPTDASRIFDALNAALQRYPQMQLATTGNYGAEQIAMKWAKPLVSAGKIPPVILAKCDFAAHGARAPFMANEDLMKLNPVHVYTLARSLECADPTTKEFGPCLNIADKAAAKKIVHQPILSKDEAKARSSQRMATA